MRSCAHVALAALIFCWLAVPAAAEGAQAVAASESAISQSADSAARAARAFYDAIGARRWDDAAALIHSERLGIVRRNLGSMVDGPSGELVLEEILSLSGRSAFQQATGPELFARLFRTLERRIEPLARVIATNEVRIVGAVPDGYEAHVVTRVTPYADGPRPSWIRVITLRREASGEWRLTDAEEITSVLTAVLGLPLR